MNNEPNDEFDFDGYDDGIFTNDESIETLRKSAEALGLNPDLVAPKSSDEDGPRYRYYAKGSCNHCFGRGVLNVVLSPSKPKVHWRNEGLPGRISKRKVTSAKKRKRREAKKYDEAVVCSPQPTPKRRKLVSGLSPGNDLGEQWNTRKEEPYGYKKENLSRSFCKCVRAIEV